MTNLPRIILEVLNRVDPNGLPETTLLAEVNLKSAERVLPSELRRVLEALDGDGEAQFVRDRDKGTVWFITTRGKARHQS